MIWCYSLKEVLMHSLIARWVALSFTVLCLAVLAASCSGGGGGDDDDDDDVPSYGSDIQGSYSVDMVFDQDTCNSSHEGADPVPWIVKIEQSGDLGTGWVSYEEEGAGSNSVDLFEGTVYGNTIIRQGVVTTGAGPSCTKVSVESYRVRVDVETDGLTGHLAKDIFYEGTGCDSSTIDCYFEQSFGTNLGAAE